MKNDPTRLANLLGALAVGISDRIRLAAAEQTSLGGEAAAALIVIGHAPGLSIDQLGKVLKLSHPGTVRVVDRLVAAGLAERKPAASDRRALALQLTSAGESERTAVLDGRRAAIAAVLDHVAPEDYPALEQLVEKMLASLPCDATTAMNVCRFCNQHACANCPMDQFGALCPQTPSGIGSAARTRAK
jgi:MarR family transcriptional repressor of emrRAB